MQTQQELHMLLQMLHMSLQAVAGVPTDAAMLIRHECLHILASDALL
jgi:hypothetical protein